VLFQFFNIFNARAEHDSAFGRQFFDNHRLWLALFGVVGLQFVVVHWAPAQAVFDTVDLTLADWALAALIASSVLLFDEMRKLAGRILRSLFAGGPVASGPLQGLHDGPRRIVLQARTGSAPL